MNGELFGYWAKSVREGKGITQVELAKMMGYGQSRISRVEKLGEATTDYAVAFAKALGIDRDVALEKLHGKKSTRSELIAEIEAEAADLEEEDQKRLLEIARALKRAGSRGKAATAKA